MISDRLCRLRKGKDGDGPLELWRTVQHDASVHERLVRPSPLHPPTSSQIGYCLLCNRLLIRIIGTAYIDCHSLTLERIDAAKADHIANREERNAEALEKAQKKLTQRRT
jgi:hypothetical protein